MTAIASLPELVAVSPVDTAPEHRPTPLHREVPPPDEYPVEALGFPLAEAAWAIEDHTQAPIAVAAQAVLAAACLAVQGHADVELPTGQTRPISIFLASVLPSGERKTATDEHAGKARREWEKTMWAEYGRLMEDARNRLAAWERERNRILRDNKVKGVAAAKAALDALGERPPTPLTPLLACPEPTFEGLCVHLAAGYPSIGIFSDEGGQFVGGHGMNEDNRLRTAAGLSGLWDGEPIRRVRAGDGTTVLPGRRVALHLMMQPGVAARLLADRTLIDQGLLSRLLVSAPEPRAGTRMWREPSDASRHALVDYHDILRALHAAPLPLAEGKPNELAPRVLRLSPEARALWIQFADHNEAQLGPGGALSRVRGLANKLPEHAARIAAVLTLTEDLDAPSVLKERMAAGIEIVQFYAAEALRLFEAGQIEVDLQEAERLRRWLLDDWKGLAIGLPEIYQRGPNAIRSAPRARRLMEILEKHDWVVRLPNGAEIDGEHRREAWAIRRAE